MCITAVNIAASADGGLLHSEASECLAWLEEQKDKNCLACDQHLKGYIAGRKVTEEEKQKEQSLRDFIDDFPYSDQKEQKPVEYGDDIVEDAEEYTSKVDCGEYGVEVTEAYIAGALRERSKKPVEWTERHIADVFEKVGLAKIVREQGNDNLTNALQSAMIELASPVEWSEEDEKELDCIINVLDRLGFEEFCKSSRDQDNEEERFYYKEIQFLKRLKSLRPSWKPSEEQMNALNFAITYFMHETNYKNPTELRDLYDDLLKLK